MRYILLALVSLIVAGCASTPSVTSVPIAVPCKVEDPIQPTYRFAPPYQDIFEGTRDLLGDREVSLAYELELRAALKSCK